MTKKKYLFLTILLILGGYLFSTSIEELTPGASSVYIKDEVGKGIISLKLNNEYGFTNLSFEVLNETFGNSYVIVKDNDGFYGPWGRKLNSPAAENIISNIANTGIERKLKGINHNIDYIDGYIDPYVIQKSPINSQVLSGNLVKLKNRPADFNVEIFIISENGDVIRLRANTSLSFFKEESNIFRKLFRKDSILSYDEKAIFYLSTLFIKEMKEGGVVKSVNYTPDRDDFLSFIENVYLGNGWDVSILPDLNTLLNNDFGPSSLYSDLKKSHDNFKYSFYSHFKVSEFKDGELLLPILNFDKEKFDSIYKDKNIYTDVYLNFLLYKNKPVLSKQIDNSLKKSGIKYNYNQLQGFDKDDGRELVKSALRYLSWGVEYTLNSRNSNLILNNNSVYSENSELLDEWILNEKESDKDKNYLSGKINVVQEPSEINSITNKERTHIINGSYTGSNFRFINKGLARDIDITRVDFWTSENIAWKKNRITGVYAGSTALESVTTLNNGSKYYDKNLSNVHNLSRTVDSEKGIYPEFTVGYKFAQPEDVTAVVVVTAHDYLSKKFEGATSGNIKSKLNKYRDDENYNLKFFVNDSEVKEVKEIIIKDRYSSIDFISGKSLGFTLAASEHYINEKDQLKYHYFIFDNKQTDIRDIKIVDKTGTSNLVISELMVFPENPIEQYLELTKNLPSKYSGPGWSYYDLSDLGYDYDQNILYNNKLKNEVIPSTYNIGDSGYLYFDINWASDRFNTEFNYKQIVVWEYPELKDSAFSNKFTLLKDSELNLTNELVLGNKIITSQIYDLYKDKFITTPFKTQGNPIPYTFNGVDTPKTFNYKMLEQNKAREWYLEKYSNSLNPDNFENLVKSYRFPILIDGRLKTTLAEDRGNKINYFDSYISETDIYSEEGIYLHLDNSSKEYRNLPDRIPGNLRSVKPFLPGLNMDGNRDLCFSNKSLYSANKTAGVDSVGMLLGSLTMTNLGHYDFPDIRNNRINRNLDNIYKSNDFDFHSRYNSILENPIRFNNSDIEKISVLVPDLEKMQEGDILVRYNKSGAPHIGIIVSTKLDGTEKNPEEIMEKTLVLSISKNFMIANLGLWKSSGNTFGGFARLGEEKNYQLRRLLKLPSDAIITSYNDNEWELLNKSIISLDIDLVLNENKYDATLKERWIPNTDELLNIGKIKIQGNYSNNIIEKLSENSRIKLLPPVDPYASEEPAGHPVDSNIYNNRGDGLEFYAVNGDKKYLLARFERKLTGGYNTVFSGLGNSITSNLNGDAFNSRGHVNDGFKFYISSNTLVFQDRSDIYREFAVKNIDGSRIVAGDDFLLKFGLIDKDEISGVSKISDLLAVYDKKMLWRANLYINEKDKDDWNNVHPWVDGNEWNQNYDGNNRLSDKNEPNQSHFLSTSNSSNGDQTVHFIKFSNIDNITGDDNNSVAYSYGCNDSPFEFLDEMKQQKNILGDNYNVDGYKFNKPKSTWPQPGSEGYTLEQYNEFIQEYTGANYPDDTIKFDSWDKSIAPGNQWSNYISANDLWSVEGNITTVPEAANSTTSDFPFVPGYALWYHFKHGEVPDWVNVISAGVDCNGFVSRSAAWLGNNYKWFKDVNITDYDQNIHNKNHWFRNPSYPVEGKDGYIITDSTDKKVNPMTLEISYPNLDKIKPGDIIHWNSHITMVREVARSEESVTLTDIKLIESTWGGKDKDTGKYTWAKVINDKTLQDYSGKNWKVIRLQ